MTIILFYFACYCAGSATFMLILSLCFIPTIISIDKPYAPHRFRVKLHWIWFDFWMGMYYDKKKRVIWFAPFPMLIFRIWWEEK